MTRFERLIEQIRELPDLQRQAGQIGKLTQFDSRIAAARDSLTATAGSERQIRANFPEANVQRALDSVRKAAREAKKAHARFAVRGDAVDDKKTEEFIAAIADAASAAKTNVKNGWSTFVQRKSSGYENLVAAAGTANLDASGMLRRALEGVRKLQNELPADQEAVREALALIEGLARAVQTIGLEGNVGRFVVAAATGDADPRILLEDAEVRQFVEDRGLWQILRVRLV